MLRATSADAMQLVSDDARVLTPYAGRPTTLGLTATTGWPTYSSLHQR
jgi:hypothetical protein